MLDPEEEVRYVKMSERGERIQDILLKTFLEGIIEVSSYIRDIDKRLATLEDRVKDIEPNFYMIIQQQSIIGKERRDQCVYNEKGYCKAKGEENMPSKGEFIKEGDHYYIRPSSLKCYYCSFYSSEKT